MKLILLTNLKQHYIKISIRSHAVILDLTRLSNQQAVYETVRSKKKKRKRKTCLVSLTCLRSPGGDMDAIMLFDHLDTQQLSQDNSVLLFDTTWDCTKYIRDSFTAFISFCLLHGRKTVKFSQTTASPKKPHDVEIGILFDFSISIQLNFSWNCLAPPGGGLHATLKISSVWI